MMAPKSSMIANAIKKIFKLVGTFLPNNEAMPSEKAISVAVGIPQPCVNAVPILRNIKINAGTTIPPSAAPKGKTALLKLDNSPLTNSRLISIPAKRKKIDIRKSLIHLSGEWGRFNMEDISALHIVLYHPPPDVLEINNEKAVHISKITPTERLSEIKNFSGLMAFVTNLFIVNDF